MILNRQQQTELFKLANGSGESTGSDIKALIADLRNTPIILTINGREIAKVIREENRSGFNFA
jgi:hypothetical protein